MDGMEEESFTTENDVEDYVQIKIHVGASDDGEVVDHDEEAGVRYMNNSEDNDSQPKLVPASHQMVHQPPVKTAAVTAVARTPLVTSTTLSNSPSSTSGDYDWMCPYDMTDNEPTQHIGRTGLENLRAVIGVPQKAAEVLEQFTVAAYSTDEQVRCSALEYLPHMALLLSEDSNNLQLKTLISTHLLPAVAASLSDHSTQVVQMAESALLTMLEHCLVGADYIETKIWPMIKARMHRAPSMENTIAVLTVMSKMTPWLGCDQTEKLLVPTLEQLSSHNDLAVRRVCASLYGDFCAVISTMKTETCLVPSFLRLCEDPEYVVRKTCAVAFMSVSCTVTLHTRRTQLAPIFARLLSDSVRWVQLAAFQSLGPFITTFAEPSITMLSYDHKGELVLKHPDGFEFRINCKSSFPPPVPFDPNKYLMVGDDNSENSFEEHQQQNKHKNQQQDDSNNNRDRVINYSYSKEESNDSNEDVSTVIEVTDDTDSYNQFQYWRDPLPNIDGDLNSNDSNTSANVVNASSSYVMFISTSLLLNNNINNNNNSPTINNEHLHPSPRLQRCMQRSQFPMPSRVLTSLSRQFQDMNIFVKDSTSAISALQPHFADSCTTSAISEEVEKSPSPAPTIPSLPPATQPPAPSEPAPPIQDIVPLELINHFVSMSDPGRDVGEGLAGHCAYSLPAVALTLGPKHWALLKPAYEALAGDRQWKVRRIVASSIHELAVIVGEEVATQDLIPVFNDFIKDLDEVRIAALKHLAHFLKLLRPAGRNSFLPRLTDFLMTDYEWNWRFRQELAEQLLQILGLFSPVDTYHHLSPVVMALLIDRVSDVRKVALQLATELVSHVSINVTLLRSLLAELAQKFAHSARWNRRQTFALFCSRLVSEGVLSGEMFARDVLPHLLDLSWDRVPNVRLTVARALANDVIVQPYFSNFFNPHYEVLHSVLKRLQGDKDRDVRYFASQVPAKSNILPANVDTQYNYMGVTEECNISSPTTTTVTDDSANRPAIRARNPTRPVLK